MTQSNLCWSLYFAPKLPNYMIQLRDVDAMFAKHLLPNWLTSQPSVVSVPNVNGKNIERKIRYRREKRNKCIKLESKYGK